MATIAPVRPIFTLDLYTPVRVYWNLREKRYSVQHRVDGAWKVAFHRDMLWLLNASFKVSDAGRERVRQERSKNVHAFVCGQWSDPRGSALPWLERSRRVLYDPYCFDGFVFDDCQDEQATEADFVIFTVEDDRPVVSTYGTIESAY